MRRLCEILALILLIYGIAWTGFSILFIASGKMFEDVTASELPEIALICLAGPILIVVGWLILRRVDRADPRGFEPLMLPPPANDLPVADNTAAADKATESRE
ncbi:MAG TPA: hypothetical protein VIL86_18135 [Tepidisphaeraceae bacterium]